MKDYFKYFDKFTFVLLLLLSAISIFLIYSAGYSSHETHYLKQAVWLIVSMLVFFIVFALKIDFIFRNAFAVYLALIVILVMQVVLGGTVARTKSWFRLWGIGFQFSEFVKIPLALYLAKILTQFEVIDWKAFVKLVGVIVAPVALIILQPDMGVSFILCSFVPLVILLKKVKPAVLVISLLLVVLSGIIGWYSILRPYQRDRIISFLNPTEYKTSTGYHVIQSKIAIGSGGLGGKGFLKRLTVAIPVPAGAAY